jgi:hypothetical protein
MLDIYNSVWLYADSLNTDGNGATYTLLVPRRNVFAQMSLTTVTPALNIDSKGWGAGTRIIKYSYFESDNVVREVFLPVDWNQNSVFVNNCASITFGLGVKNTWAYALGVVFTY